MSTNRVACNLKRSPEAVFWKANRMGLRYSENDMGLTASQIAEACGVYRIVVSRWIRLHGLKAARVKRGSGYIYKIRPRDFWKWVATNNDKVNVRNIQRFVIMPEPKWLKERLASADNEQHSRRNKVLKADEINRVKELYYSGHSVSEIAIICQRSDDAIRHILRRR